MQKNTPKYDKVKLSPKRTKINKNRNPAHITPSICIYMYKQPAKGKIPSIQTVQGVKLNN